MPTFFLAIWPLLLSTRRGRDPSAFVDVVRSERRAALASHERPRVTRGLASWQARVFAAGTEIAKPSGAQPVETLAVGDLVTTQDGRAVPVKWLAEQTIVTQFHKERAQLVRIAAGALRSGLPTKDLLVTGDHGMVLDVHLVNAAALVNGTTIDWVPFADTEARFTVYHVETDAHDIILANGAATETYLTAPDRKAFDNYRADLALYGEASPILESPLPRITAARLLPEALKTRLGIGGADTIDAHFG